mgnify:CR=1 FL=1
MPSSDHSRSTQRRLTRAARIHGTDKLAVSEFGLPDIGPDELLLRVVSSSMCLSTYKAMSLGEEHKRVPSNLAEVPVMTGHEFAGVLEEVGESLQDRFTPGQSVAILPTMSLPSGYSPGYSYPYYGGDATYCIVPEIAVENPSHGGTIECSAPGSPQAITSPSPVSASECRPAAATDTIGGRTSGTNWASLLAWPQPATVAPSGTGRQRAPRTGASPVRAAISRSSRHRPDEKITTCSVIAS